MVAARITHEFFEVSPSHTTEEPGHDKPGAEALVSEGALRRWLARSEVAIADERDATAMSQALLEAFACSAFIVRGDGFVLLANARGHAELVERTFEPHLWLEGGDVADDVGTSPLPPGADGRSRTLVLHDVPAAAAASIRMGRAVKRWTLTRCQSDILCMLVHGRSNKSMADRRGCALRTVEVHVSALLEKSNTASRAELVARFWTLA